MRRGRPHVAQVETVLQRIDLEALVICLYPITVEALSIPARDPSIAARRNQALSR
jgi:hypothetical protein